MIQIDVNFCESNCILMDLKDLDIITENVYPYCSEEQQQQIIKTLSRLNLLTSDQLPKICSDKSCDRTTHYSKKLGGYQDMCYDHFMDMLKINREKSAIYKKSKNIFYKLVDKFDGSLVYE